MDQPKQNSKSFIQRAGAAIKSAADRFQSGATIHLRPEADRQLVWPLGIDDAGISWAGGRSPYWYRTDQAVYLLRYEHGWGKAAPEMEARPGRLVSLENIELQRTAPRAA